MNRRVLLLMSVLLTSCVGQHKLQPSLYSNGESLLSRGVLDYKRDHFTAAEQKFNQALRLYQSIDNAQGVRLARINLVKTLLALTKLDQAEKQLMSLTQKPLGDKVNSKIKQSIVLLEVKFLFKKKQYRKSLQRMAFLLIPLEKDKKSSKPLELLAIAARLETLIWPKIEPYWLNGFRKYLGGETKIALKFLIILKRIEAILATQNKQYPQALSLLHETLDYYKGQEDRRAIADCLEEMADIELKQNNLIRGRGYLKRALMIREWLKDQYQSDIIKEKLMAVH